MTGKMGSRDRRSRARLLHVAQQGLCAICWKPMPHPDEARDERARTGDPTVPRPDDPTLEHVILKSRDGPNDLSNLLLTHHRCNNARGDRRLPRTALLMRRRVAVWLANHFAKLKEAA